MILVTGATGTIGQHLVPSLLESGRHVRALIRPRGDRQVTLPPQVNIANGDPAHIATLDAALEGVSQVFLCIGNGPQQEWAEQNIVAQAAKAGVERIVKVSAPVVGDDAPVAIARMHHRIEQAIVATGMAYTFLRPGSFMQNLLQQSPLVAARGQLLGSTGDAPINQIDARDIADVAAVALTSGTIDGAVPLTGSRAYTMQEIADLISQVTQRRITFVNLTPQEHRRVLEAQSLPEWLVHHILEIQAMARSHPERPNDKVLRLTGRAPRELPDFLRHQASAFGTRQPPHAA
ncbi:SDR family oxidoreductase [Devosia sp.]|jgi:uncharacterized protein YbjT (DUF2867 family)|uniref:SDR family oxidoreductase n=1 Tax=Devosia sp. TaxID=1871048 RepID=UPI0037BF944F